MLVIQRDAADLFKTFLFCLDHPGQHNGEENNKDHQGDQPEQADTADPFDIMDKFHVDLFYLFSANGFLDSSLISLPRRCR